MAYQLASEGRHFLESQGIRPGRRVKSRGRWEPDGTIHALDHGAPRTVCGVSVADLCVFPDFTWPKSYYGASENRCTECTALLEGKA